MERFEIIDISKLSKFKSKIVYPLGMCYQDVDEDDVQEKIICIGDENKQRVITGKFDQFGQAKIPVFIGCGGKKAVEVMAVIDTGAYFTCVHEYIAERLGATKMKITKSSTPYGIQEMPTYMMNYIIDGDLDQNFVSEVRGINFDDVPMLLGAQFLTQYCDFKYFGKENRFELIINP